MGYTIVGISPFKINHDIYTTAGLLYSRCFNLFCFKDENIAITNDFGFDH